MKHQLASNRNLRPLLASLGIVSVILLSACTSLSLDPAEHLLGNWQTEVGGFSIAVQYTETQVIVADHAPVAYVLSGNELRFVDGGEQSRLISFTNKDTMSQLDPLTNTSHRYIRTP